MHGVIVKMVNGDIHDAIMDGSSVEDAQLKAGKITDAIMDGIIILQLLLNPGRSVFIVVAHIVSIEPY